MADDELDVRLGKLKSALNEKKRAEEEAVNQEKNKTDWSGLGLAYRMTAEFAAGAGVGALLGYAVDQIFSTTPWGIIVLLIFGCFAGFLNVLRAAGRLPEKADHSTGHDRDDSASNDRNGQ